MTSEPFGMHGMSKDATSVWKRQVASFMFSTALLGKMVLIAHGL